MGLLRVSGLTPRHAAGDPLCVCHDCQVRRQVPGARRGVVKNDRLVPLFFCLKCEQPQALIVIRDKAPNVVHHECLGCRYVRVVDDPIPSCGDMIPL